VAKKIAEILRFKGSEWEILWEAVRGAIGGRIKNKGMPKIGT